MMKKKLLAAVLTGAMTISTTSALPGNIVYAAEETTALTEETVATSDVEREAIEEALNLANNAAQEWTYSQEADAWTLSVVSSVLYPELPDQQGVSVCVPGAYVTGIDTDLDGAADVTAQDIVSGNAESAVLGRLVIDYEASVTSENGQVYTAATAPVIINTGAAGYGSQSNQTASTAYAANGFINVACGNRGKQDSMTDEDGNTVYTGDAPSCLVDQKNAVRFVKYNILLGNLPGSVDYFVSTGGSGGGAHATMLAATSNNSDFYDYEIEAGAVGVYRNEDGSYSTTVTIDGTDYEISDGMWGCVAYSAITSLAEADMAMAFEYYLDTDYSFNTSFQAQVAEYLSEEYMDYINAKGLSVEESAVGFDLSDDGDQEDTIDLTIEYDEEAYANTNGYGGTYLDLYLKEFVSNLQWYLDNLDYAEGWTWFDADGNALSDEAVAAMTSEEKAQAFIEGRYTKSSSGGRGGMGGPGGNGGMMGGPGGEGGFGGRGGNGGFGGPGGNGFPGGNGGPDGNGGFPGGDGNFPGGDGTFPGGDMELSESEMPEGMGEDAQMGEMPEGMSEDAQIGEIPQGMEAAESGTEAASEETASTVKEMVVGTPDAGTTQAAGSGKDSSNYSSFEEMLAAYEADIEEIASGDRYGNNQVDLYNPLNYVGADDTDDPTWVRIMMGASEGDMSMFSSMNLQIVMLNAGIDANIEWQWDGGHVPSEILGESLALYVDEMYAAHVDGAAQVTKAEVQAQTENGTSESASGTDLSSWVNYEDLSNVSFTLADAVSYRTSGASKATPGFDVMDYGQEDYVFGSSEKDARHWDTYLLKVFQEHAQELAELFNAD